MLKELKQVELEKMILAATKLKEAVCLVNEVLSKITLLDQCESDIAKYFTENQKQVYDVLVKNQNILISKSEIAAKAGVCVGTTKLIMRRFRELNFIEAIPHTLYGKRGIIVKVLQ